MPAAPIRQRTRHAPRSKAKMELVTTSEQTCAERLVKLTDRLRGLSAVLNPAATVDSVLDLWFLWATPKPVNRSFGRRSSKRDS